MVNPDPLRFEPELEALLHEIARDPRSTLLRIERPPRPIDLVDSWEAISRWTPGLTVAERHLLDVYRADTAGFLLERWLHEVTVRPRKGYSLSRRSSVDGAPISDEDQAEARRETLRRHLLDGGQEDLSKHVASVAFGRHLDPSELSGLLVCAEKLLPRVEGKLLLAQDLVLNGQPRSAVFTLRRCMQVETRDWMKSLLWHNLGFAVGDTGDLRTALSCYARAARLGEPRVNAMAYRLILSAQLGDSAELYSAAQELEHAVESTSPKLDGFVQEQERTRADGAWAPTAVAGRLVPRIKDQLGSAARRVLDVLA